MKIGMRKPSIKKSIKARTTGKMKRSVKKAVNPLYGKKGMGLVNDPKKAVYNKAYNKTTVGVSDVVSSSPKKKTTSTKTEMQKSQHKQSTTAQKKNYRFENGNTIYIGNNKMTYSQLTTYKNTFLVFGIIISLISLFIMPFGIITLIIGIILISTSNHYKKVENDFLKYRINQKKKTAK